MSSVNKSVLSFLSLVVLTHFASATAVAHADPVRGSRLDQPISSLFAFLETNREKVAASLDQLYPPVAPSEPILTLIGSDFLQRIRLANPSRLLLSRAKLD